MLRIVTDIVSFYTPVAGRIMTSKAVCVLIPESCKYVILYGKKDLTDATELRIMRWEDYPGLSGWASVITRIIVRGRQEGQHWKRRYDHRSRSWSDVAMS